MSGFSWRGGTKPSRTQEQNNNPGQSEEPPAEWWEQRQAEFAGVSYQ